MENQMKIGEVAIENVKIDLSSRDEIPKVLIGLQNIYKNNEVREQVFNALEDLVPENVNMNNGRPGMNLWTILVLGTIRVSTNWDFDKLREIANNHLTLREMLGLSKFNSKQYPLQTIKDNISLFTPGVLDKINQIVVIYGHEIIGKKPDEELKGSCDSSVVKTNVHYPTDINVLFDAMRIMIVTIMLLCDQLCMPGWKKGIFNLKKVKKLFIHAQRVTSKNKKKKKNTKNKKKINKKKKKEKEKEKEKAIIDAHSAYIDFCEFIIVRVKDSIESITSDDMLIQAKIFQINNYIAHAERQIDQTRRRVIKGESIPHHEKVFSIFEEHTRWISKGKAGVPQELGLPVCFVKDQYGFILYHYVMHEETDEKVAVPVIKEVKKRFPDFNSCSFDKGFHSPYNQEELKKILDKVILPRKGKLSAINKEIESSDEFKEARRKHAAVESSIGALQNHGLDRCPDHGIDGFERYVALGVLARNIQILGHTIQQKELKRQKKEKKQRLLAA